MSAYVRQPLRQSITRPRHSTPVIYQALAPGAAVVQTIIMWIQDRF